MSVRLPLVVPFVALAALALSGCKKEQQAAAPAAPRDCCCKQTCPTDAAPAAKAEAKSETVRVARSAPGGRRSHRTRTYAAREQAVTGGDYYASGDTARRYAGDGYVTRERRSERYEGGGYGGRYGASGRAVSGVSVSVEESETSSERVRYRESSSSYGSSSYGAGAGSVRTGGGYYAATGYYEDRDGRVRRAGPAGTDHAGYLTWPGKVEEED